MDGNKSNSNDQQFISFQDFSPVRSGGQALIDIDIPQQQPYNNFPSAPPAGNITNSENLQQETQNEDKPLPSFWTIEYYQKYFKVTTNDVVGRIQKSMIPTSSENYLLTHIRPNPDLYGPFWICITLVFAIAISGNIANYFQTANSPKGEKLHWKYDFHLVSQAATCIFLYAWLLPLGIWTALKWTDQAPNNEDELIASNTKLGLLEIICLYGYSLFIYIPVTFLCAIPVNSLQWIFVGVAAFLSGGILLRSLLPVINGKHKYIYITVIVGVHFVVAAAMIYFYHAPENSIDDTIHNIVSSTTTAAPKVLDNNKTTVKTS